MITNMMTYVLAVYASSCDSIDLEEIYSTDSNDALALVDAMFQLKDDFSYCDYTVHFLDKLRFLPSDFKADSLVFWIYENGKMLETLHTYHYDIKHHIFTKS